MKGLDVAKYGKEVRKKIGYVVSDERSFYWRLTGRQNLRFFSVLNNISAEDASGERKRSVLYATHNLQEAEELCDRIAIISKGSIKYVGTVDALKKEFRHDAHYIIREMQIMI